MDAVLWLGRALSVMIQERAVVVGAAVLLGGIVLAWLVRRSASPAAGWLVSAVVVALFAESLVVAGGGAAGAAVFAVAAVAAVVGGRGKQAEVEDHGVDPPGRHRRDGLVIAALTVTGCVLTLYALNEHPEYFFNEKISTFLQITSFAGIRVFMASGWFSGNSVGLVDLPLLWLLTKALGGSMLAVRLTSALAAAATVPVFYAFVRRIGGPWAAGAATVLLLAQPTHLWFARTDYTHFVFVALYVVILAWITLRAMESGGWWWIAVIGFMAGSRFAYASGQVAWLIPVGMLAHGAVCGRPGSRPRWIAWCSVGAGALLWVVGATLAVGAFRGELRWVPAVATYGAASWQQVSADAGLLERVAAALSGATGNLADLLAGLFSNIRFGELFWYRWSHRPDRAVWAVSAAAALTVPAIGWLATRWRQREAALLLGWIVIAIIPGCLSEGMGARRVLMLFPAVYAAVGLFLAAMVESLRREEHRGARWAVTTALAALLLGVLVVGANGSLRATTRRPDLVRQGDFVGSLIERNELLVHDLEPRHEATLAYFNLSALTNPDSPRGIQAVSREQWPTIALHPRFAGDAEFYGFIGERQAAAERARVLDPASVAFMLRDVEANRAVFSLIERLYPEGVTTSCCGEVPGAGLRAVEVPRRAIRAAARPELRWREVPSGGGNLDRVLADLGVNLRVDETRTVPVLRAGLNVVEAGWYALSWNPTCGTIALVGDARVQPNRWMPLLRGVHPLSIELAGEDGCGSGLGLRWRRSPGTASRPVDDSLTSPRVASIDGARPEAMGIFAGYGSRDVLVEGLGGLWDLSGDAASGVAAVCRDGGIWSVHRFDTSGRELASWRLPGGPRRRGVLIALSPFGEVALLSETTVDWFAEDGESTQTWTSPDNGLLTDIAFDRAGRLWATHFDKRRLLVIGDGEVEAAFELVGIGGNRDARPIGLAVDGRGRATVILEDGLVLVLRVALQDASVSVERSFRIPLPAPLDFIRLDTSGGGWLHVTTRPASGWWSYDPSGVRRMAASPQRGLFGSVIERGTVVAAVGDAVLVYDEADSTLWRMAPTSAAD
jgi:hypothetical protein